MDTWELSADEVIAFIDSEIAALMADKTWLEAYDL